MRAWFAFALMVAIGLAVIIAQLLATGPGIDALILSVGFVIYACMGGLILARRDGHLTGWLLTLSGLVIVLADSSGRPPFVGSDVAAWVGSWGWISVFAVFAALTLTFPSGQPPQGANASARFGRFALFALPILVMLSALTRTLGGPEQANEQSNPFGFLPDFLAYPSLIGVVAIFAFATISLIFKRRKASGVERAQLTWVVFALAVFVAMVGATTIYVMVAQALTGIDPGEDAWTPVFIMMILFPLSFAIAILRYRLFDIDRIVSRTVSYTIVAALLASAFFAVVTLLGTLIPVDDSSWQVAGSTLVVAALFNPARLRVQRFVGRRFNRRHYDSQLVAAALTMQIRDQIDPLAIGEAWVRAVESTFQPSAISFWLKDDSAGT